MRVRAVGKARRNARESEVAPAACLRRAARVLGGLPVARRAHNSAVECVLHTDEVAGSIPAAPTGIFAFLGNRDSQAVESSRSVTIPVGWWARGVRKSTSPRPTRTAGSVGSASSGDCAHRASAHHVPHGRGGPRIDHASIDFHAPRAAEVPATPCLAGPPGREAMDVLPRCTPSSDANSHRPFAARELRIPPAASPLRTGRKPRRRSYSSTTRALDAFQLVGLRFRRNEADGRELLA